MPKTAYKANYVFVDFRKLCFARGKLKKLVPFAALLVSYN